MKQRVVLQRRDGVAPGARLRPRLDRWCAEEEQVVAHIRAGAPARLLLSGAETTGPQVLLTMDRDAEAGVVYVDAPYVQAVLRAGGTPVLVPPGPWSLEQVWAGASGLVLTGGAFDIHPQHYGALVDGRLDRVEASRTELELTLARHALSEGVPVLGVCGGLQALAVAAGGTLIQDLPEDPTHEQPTDPGEVWHKVYVDAPLSGWWGPTVWVNSTHHQAVDHVGTGGRVVARSPDGVIEAVAYDTGGFALGVQWHPERLGQYEPYRALLRAIAAQPTPRPRPEAPPGA